MSGFYKGIELLSCIGPTFAVWETDVHGFMQRNHLLALNAMEADPADENANLDEQAASVIRMFMTSALKMKYNHLVSGRLLWARMRSDFAAYQTAHAPLLDKQMRVIRPKPLESVADYVARAEVLARQLEALGRAVDLTQLRDLIWEGLEHERPAWGSTIEALRVTMRNNPLADIAAEMSRLEVSKLLRSRDRISLFWSKNICWAQASER